MKKRNTLAKASMPWVVASFLLIGQNAVLAEPAEDSENSEPVQTEVVADNAGSSGNNGNTENGQKADLTGKTITKVAVAGNRLVTDQEILGAAHLKAGLPLSTDLVRKDLQSIYELGWFYDVGTDFVEVPEGVQVTYKVRENPIYRKLELSGNTKLSTKEIESLLDLKKETLVNGKTLNDSVRKIEERYHKDGYILMRVSDVNIRPDGTLNLVVNEGIVEGFTVKGNTKTKPYVIEREMRLKKGEPFNVKEARRSMQRLYNLGYFEDVNVKLNPGKQPNGVEVEITVAEQRTGTFGIGAGYSNDDGFVGVLMLGDKNYKGTGDKVNVRWEFGGVDNKNYEFSYVKPWLDKKQTSQGFSIYQMTNEYTEYYDDTTTEKDTYDKRRKGWDITLGRPQDEYTTNSITLKHREDSYVQAVEDETTHYYDNNPEAKTENFGLTQSVMLQHVRDTRDNVFNPTKGNRYLLAAEFAGGGFGGDFTFNKYTAEGRKYFDCGSDHVIAVRLTGGWADGTMPLSQRFALGGSDTLRGYKDDQFKGYKMLSSTLEYRFPIVKKIQGVVFGDGGYAWEKGANFDFADLKTSLGVGLRVVTPLGPIRLDYAKGEQEGRFHFSFGGQF